MPGGRPGGGVVPEGMDFVFLTPSPDPAGGGSRFNAGLVPALRAAGHGVTVRHDAELLPDGVRPVVDGLLLPDLEPRLDALLAAGAVAVVHHVSARAGRDDTMNRAGSQAELRMLPRLSRVIATSRPVAGRLQVDYGLVDVPVLLPGMAELGRGEGSGGPGVHILSAGVITPRKGHDRLLRALSRLVDLDWTLTIAGDAQRDAVHAGSVAAAIEEHGLSSRVTLLANPSDAALDAEWARADLFALASSWEAYPSGIAEALRRGIPVVGTSVGDVPAMVPHSAGVLCPADDAVTLSKCLRRAIFDGGLRAALAEGAWQVGLAMPGWPQQALAFLSLIEE